MRSAIPPRHTAGCNKCHASDARVADSVCRKTFAKLPRSLEGRNGMTRMALARSGWARGSVAAAAAVAFLWAAALSVSPALHQRVHSDAKLVDHSCAVTFVRSGSYDHPATALPSVAPNLPKEFATLPELVSSWVRSPFLGAAIFEHAPPYFS